MLNLRFPAFILLIGLGALGCSSESNTPNDTGGAGGTGGSGGAGGTGGSTGGSSGAAGGGNCPTFNYAGYNPTMSPTFKNDIQPFLPISCALSGSCHQNGSAHRPHLGKSPTMLDGGKPTDAEMQTMIEELKRMSTEVAGRAIMAPGKPEDSYLMNKLEGTNNCSGFVCMGPEKCGLQMPDPGMPLEKATIEIVRAWIKKGAPL
jgi:hypothetical protein